MKEMHRAQLCYISVFTQPRPKAVVRERCLISYFDPANQMKSNLNSIRLRWNTKAAHPQNLARLWKSLGPS
jgi:hypothetical protein